MMINRVTNLSSENLTNNSRKTDEPTKNYQENWAIFPEPQTENLPRWLKVIEETENKKQNANRKR